MSTQAEAAEKLNQVTAQLVKVQAEIQKLIDAAASEDEISPELQAAIDGVSAAAQAADDKNPDAPV